MSITPLIPADPTSRMVCQSLLNSLKQQLKGSTDIKNAHCPQTTSPSEDWGFKFEGNSFAFRNLGRDVHAPTLPGSCGFTPYTGGFLAMDHEFPDIPEVGFVPSPFPAVCTHQQPCAEDLQIWAHHHAVLVHMTSGEVTDPQQIVGNPAVGLSGHATDSGRTDILLRLIRQP